MHNGVFTTLAQVMQLYSTESSVAPLSLTPQEMADPAAFMREM